MRGDKSISANTSIILLSNQSYVVYPTAPTRSSTHFSTVLGVNITIETPSVLRDVIVETEGSGEKFEDLRMSSDEPFTMGLDDHNSTVLSENGPLEVETGEKDKKELDFVTSALTEPPNTTTTPRIDQMRIFRFFELH